MPIIPLEESEETSSVLIKIFSFTYVKFYVLTYATACIVSGRMLLYILPHNGN